MVIYTNLYYLDLNPQTQGTCARFARAVSCNNLSIHQSNNQYRIHHDSYSLSIQSITKF